MTLLERRRALMGMGSSQTLIPFAYWDESDAPSSKIWTDRINGLQLTLSNSNIYSNSQYLIPNGYKMIMKDSLDSYLEYEIMVEIGYDFQLNDTNKNSAKIIDFGSYGSCKWDYGFCILHETDGGVSLNPKNKSNQTQTNTKGYTDSYTKGDWLYNQVAKAGIRVLANGYQQVWAKIGNGETYTTGNLTKVKLTPVPINGIGGLSVYGYFSLGSQGSADSFNENFIVHYIKLYSISL